MATKRNWNQCRKKRYRDEHTVNIYRRKFEEARGTKLDYYWCAYCNGFHLTSEEFRPEGYGLEKTEGDTGLVKIVKSEDVDAKNYYLGKKKRIRLDITEFERMLCAI